MRNCLRLYQQAGKSCEGLILWWYYFEKVPLTQSPVWDCYHCPQPGSHCLFYAHFSHSRWIPQLLCQENSRCPFCYFPSQWWPLRPPPLLSYPFWVWAGVPCLHQRPSKSYQVIYLPQEHCSYMAAKGHVWVVQRFPWPSTAVQPLLLFLHIANMQLLLSCY